jgi:beta-glucanase (GH16 family)
MTDYSGVQAAADAFAASAVAQATAPLKAQIADLQAKVAALNGLPVVPAGWTEAFSDTFTGSALDGSKWTATTDTAANELSARLPGNVTTDGARLSIRAQRQPAAGRQFTSGYVTTAGHASWDFFRLAVRARWTDLYGLWPAIWLRDDTGLGEIDVMEAVGGVRKLVQTVHQSTNGDMDKAGSEWPMPAGWSPSDWHVYGLERQNTGTLIWTIDGQPVFTRTRADLGSKSHQPMAWLTGSTFAGPLHLIINLQVGGTMPAYYLGSTYDPTRILPAGAVGSLDIDYVQVLTPAG